MIGEHPLEWRFSFQASAAASILEFGSLSHIQKYRLPVQVHLVGDTNVLLGVVHVRQDQRVLDMLCDPRSFFPVETRDGVFIINKASVTKIALARREDIERVPDGYPDVNLDALARRSEGMKEID